MNVIRKMVPEAVKRFLRRWMVWVLWNLQLIKASKYTPEEAKQVLSGFYHRDQPLFLQNNVLAPRVDLQIIVPVYNVESYLEACIVSILNQKTDFSFRITLVNDGATDGSDAVLQNYESYPNVDVIRKENGGLSSARNAGLRKILGEYVMFVDSDDILAENAVQVLMEAARTHSADIAEGGHQCFSNAGMGSVHVHGTQAGVCESRALFGYAWGKVIRSVLLTDFCFPESYLFEDTVMSTLLHPACKVTCTVPDVIYYYRENPSGISSTVGESPCCLDSFWIMKYCLEERVRRGQILENADQDRYLFAMQRNWWRSCRMPEAVQEAVFVLSCELIDQYFGILAVKYCGTAPRLMKTVQKRSYRAFVTLVRNQWMM